MTSAAKSIPVADRAGRRSREESGVVEMDVTFGRLLGLADGQKVGTQRKLD